MMTMMQEATFPGKKELTRALLVGLAAWLVVAANQHAEASDPPAAKASLPEVARDEDEFYAHVDKVNSPTELMVTVLDVWDPMDKLKGPRWPEGKAKVRPTKRLVILEDTVAPKAAEHKKAALEFLDKTLKDSGNEVICTGSNVSVRKESGGEIICITACVFVKKGFTLNNTLVRQGLATTTNPFYKSWQEEAKQKKLGMWRDQK